VFPGEPLREEKVAEERLAPRRKTLREEKSSWEKSSCEKSSWEKSSWEIKAPGRNKLPRHLTFLRADWSPISGPLHIAQG
jgi:hypothetical protein